MLNSTSTTPVEDRTLTKASSSTSSKGVFTGTTDKSDRSRYTAGLIGTGLELSCACRLWRAVLAQAVRDICGGDQRVRLEVLKWTDTTDFEDVCEFAKVHTDDMRDEITALAGLSRNLAKKYGRLLREKIVAGIHHTD